MYAPASFAALLFTFALTVTASAQPVTPALQGEAAGLAQEALQDELAYELVTSLTTEVGPRLAGTEAEARARAWAVARLRELGFSNVREEPFELPVWERGLEQASIVSPFPQPLVISALGGSAATGPEGITGEVVAFPSLAALEQADPAAVRGKIVFIDEVMTRTQDGSGYTVATAKRRQAAYVTQAKGGLAALIRSVGTSSHRFAHTGQMRRVTEVAEAEGVPAAALSAPDADQLQRILSGGESVRIHLLLTPEQRPAGKSANVIAEIPGRERPQEIVLVGAHIDSWDLGTGAVDDGAGVGIVVAAAKRVLDALPEGPRRTVRVVLFGAEEVGLVGAKAYASRHADALANHVIASESDFGAGRIWRFETRVRADRVDAAQALGAVVRQLGAAPGGNTATGGPDMKYLREAGVPVVGLKQNGWDYFDLHHTPNDTLDKIDPEDLAHNVAAWVSFIFLAANSGEYYR
ncbi:M20/M25/M40 family metallo-hydrolase [Pseudohalioglobus sediminis]|uniref:Carboxypeptidase Q n=1 Tax=Pseudohalioglobus sediminis TaxID=2606449 RepID=A0A5B0WNL8_9GAMM|nr:M20/M25/M40 family metallo-hydrolase [Pseudohalioglobus sediminis]KAA1188177.1 M20/M25/M40 family metallo-hydrolase [Pseudohalioglobus sediminis]